ASPGFGRAGPFIVPGRRPRGRLRRRWYVSEMTYADDHQEHDGRAPLALLHSRPRPTPTLTTTRGNPPAPGQPPGTRGQPHQRPHGLERRRYVFASFCAVHTGSRSRPPAPGQITRDIPPPPRRIAITRRQRSSSDSGPASRRRGLTCTSAAGTGRSCRTASTRRRASTAAVSSRGPASSSRSRARARVRVVIVVVLLHDFRVDELLGLGPDLVWCRRPPAGRCGQQLAHRDPL